VPPVDASPRLALQVLTAYHWACSEPGYTMNLAVLLGLARL